MIDFFNWFKRRHITDPAFGRLVRRRGAWHGLVDVNGWVEVRVYADYPGPTDNQRQQFIEFRERFDEVRMAIQSPLYEYYRSEKDDYENDNEHDGIPAVLQPGDIWKASQLVSVDVKDDGAMDLLLMTDWHDPEHVVTVSIKNCQVV
ncbi:MAG: hypothetical protein K8T91_24410 [Planctomycetes bacterium]|nr:hypothetical protein [Planctomycetota bacterium]